MTTISKRFPREIDAAMRALRAASEVCQRVQRGRIAGGTLTKGDKSPVTIADFGSQAIVCRELARALPGDAVMGEEDAAELREPGHSAIADAVVDEVRQATGVSAREEILGWIDRARSDGGRGRFWTLDPIDGTKGFLRGEQYAVALALLDGGVVEIGALACPNLSGPHGKGVLLIAARGEGAWRFPLTAASASESAGERVRVSSGKDPAHARLLESVEAAHGDHGSHDRIGKELRVTATPVRLDSQAKYAVLAQGDAEVYLRMPTSADYRENVWDHVAGARIVEEAGGRVSDVRGRPLDATKGRKFTGNQGVVATNGALPAAFLAAIAKVGGLPA
jgi:3'(2'), 5'-bisphosphate nucleotidase